MGRAAAVRLQAGESIGCRHTSVGRLSYENERLAATAAAAAAAVAVSPELCDQVACVCVCDDDDDDGGVRRRQQRYRLVA